MATQLEIYNMALALIGKPALTSVSGTDELTSKCNAVYALERDSLLREHEWNFAIKREAISTQGDAIPGGWAYRWTLPVGCLRVLSVNEDDGEYPATERVPFAVENGYILTNACLETEVEP